MKKIMTLLMSGLFVFSSFAGTYDVTPKGMKKGDLYVRVTKLKNKKISFEKCIKGFEESTCETLGRKTSYSVKELQDQRAQENSEVGYTLIADAAILLTGGSAICLGGIYLLSIAAAQTATAAVLTTAGVTTSLAGAGYLVSMVDALNPSVQAAQVQSINENVIHDVDVIIEKEEINDFINRIDLVLSKI
jgi:hypothetical protein